ncbi:T9SS type A sorting domain-containing protein [Algibacter sp. 2305UL17-15]|uniref:T9SS type A sorting domain-containing protein n=1 Tax=Algibacter sp. 2305UL17-15 TaxID=3231268 RepID=UPI00345A1477
MKTKITLVLLFLICYSTSYSQVAAFRHYATADNIDGEISVINDVRLNGNPDLVVLVENGRVEDNGTIINNPHFVGVRYNSITGRYYVYNENPVHAMPLGSCYNIAAYEENALNFKHDVDSGTIVSGSDNASKILLGNDDPNKRILYGRSQPADDGGSSSPVTADLPIELYYNYANPGAWYIAVPFGQTMPLGLIFNLATPQGFVIYEHQSTFANTGSEVIAIDDFSYWTVLDHLMLNNNPNAIIFVQHRREPATGFVFRLLSVYYNSVTGRWQIHIELENFISGFSFPEGRFFDVFIYDSALSTNGFVKKNVKVFPNPTDSKFTIQANKPIGRVSIFNMLGQKLNDFSGKGNDYFQIDMSNFKSGHYFAKVQVDSNFETIKLIKN